MIIQNPKILYLFLELHCHIIWPEPADSISAVTRPPLPSVVNLTTAFDPSP